MLPTQGHKTYRLLQQVQGNPDADHQNQQDRHDHYLSSHRTTSVIHVPAPRS